ncbi:MAG: dockerin type I domain-containing protein [Caldilineales bacterium]
MNCLQSIRRRIYIPALVFILLALLMPATAQAQSVPNDLTWTQVYSAPGVYWYTLDFPTASVGYAIGGPDWNVNEGIGPATLAKTTDGGRTWNTLIIPQTNRFMRGLACIDAQRCWVIGASSPRIRYTTDGGVTWATSTIVNSIWTGWLWSAGYTGMGDTIFAGTTGYADEPGRRANLLRAEDGINFNAVVANDPREFVIYDFSCPAPGVCYSAAKQTAFYTANNGATLIRRAAPSARYYGIWCTDTNTCWLAGGSNSAGDGIVYIDKTTDGGATWQRASITSISGRPRLWNIQMADAQHGYAVGCTQVPDAILETCTGQGLLLRTDDGVTWTPIPSPTNADIMDLSVSSMGELIVVDWNGKIWRGSDGSPTNPYDVNQDGVVDVLDISLTAEHWQFTVPDDLTMYDFNGNGVVDIGDIMLCAAHMT